MKPKIIIFFIAVVIAACHSEKKADIPSNLATDAAPNSADSLKYGYDSVKVYSKTPVSVNLQVTDTAKAVISYPVFTDEAINTFLLNKVLSSSAPDVTYNSYEEYAKSFIQGFDDFRAKNKDGTQTWFLTINTKVVRQTTNYLALFTTYVNFSGGAHPNSALVYYNYDPSTHKQIVLDSLFKPGSLTKLNAIAEKTFRKNEKLGATDSLKGNYFFENDQFKLNDNFTITDRGLLFLYNPYEIKAYVYGTTELLIPFNELKEIAKPNSLLVN